MDLFKFCKLFLLAIIGASFFLQNASAYKSDQFKGFYRILSRVDKSRQFEGPGNAEYLFIDVDTLENIWTKYGDGKLPENLMPIKDEPSVFAYITDKDFLFLALEKNTLVNDRYLAVHGSNGDVLEVAKRSDGNYDMGVRKNGKVSIYMLGAPTVNPSFWGEFHVREPSRLYLSPNSVNY